MKRLETVLSLIQKTGTLADVGCDHGKLCYEALEKNLCQKVYASDISLPSLNKAKRLLENFENALFFHCNGLSDLPWDMDTIVVSGMGAFTIQDILFPYDGNATLILQPQNHAEDLRRFLCARGYKITADKVAFESNKFYPVVRFEKGLGVYGDKQYFLGTEADCPSDAHLKYYERLLTKFRRYPGTKENLKKIQMLTEVLKCR